MSSSSSITDSSQNNAETEVMEIEGETCPIAEEIEDDDCVRPYEGEPVADDEWISQYKARKVAKEERLEIYRSRLEGSKTLDSWCKCGNCSTEYLQNVRECQCCVEIDACVEALASDQVLSEVCLPPKCITLHPGFNQVCLGIWSLRLAARKYRKIDKTKYEQTGSENRFLRAVSYRDYIQLVYGTVGRRRIPLPACAYHAIRKTFLEDEDFHGYEDE